MKIKMITWNHIIVCKLLDWNSWNCISVQMRIWNGNLLVLDRNIWFHINGLRINNYRKMKLKKKINGILKI